MATVDIQLDGVSVIGGSNSNLKRIRNLAWFP